MAFLLKKYYDNFGGQNLRSPELTRNQSIATETKNCILSDNLSIRKRRGYEITITGQGGAGATTFNQVDIATGISTQSRVVVDDSLHIEQEQDIVVTYTGTTGNGAVSFLLDPDTATFKCNLYVDATIVHSIDCGTGKGISDISVTDLIAEIDTIAGFSATTTGTGNTRAAFVSSTVFEESPSTLKYREYTAAALPTGLTAPFSGHWTTRNNDDFELAQFAQTNDVLYITNGVDGLFKYDGVRLYKAGLPTPTAVTTSTVAGSLTGSYLYRVFYRHTDATENIIVGDFIDLDPQTLTNEDVVLTIPTLQEGSGFDTDSADLEIVILRTTAGGALFYEIATVANDTSVTTIDFTDSTPDANAIIQFTEPVIRTGLPPVSRYIDVWRNQIILTGDPEAVNRVYFSDIEFPEGFSVLNSFETSSRLGGANSGVKSLDNFLYVFKANSITTVTGDLNNGQFQVDTLSDEGIGCLSANSLVEVGGQIWFLSRKGIYSVVQDSVSERSEALKPLFNNRTYTAIRSVSVNWIEERVALFTLPTMQVTAGETICNKEQSQVLCFDLESGAWTIWDNIDMTAGVSLDLDELWTAGTFTSSAGAVIRANTEFLQLNTNQDYADNEEAISFEYAGHWETLGEPAVPKKFHRIIVYSVNEVLEDFNTSPFTLTVETNRNYVDALASTWELSFAGVTSGWGEFPWGTAPWGETNLRARKTRLAARKSRSLRVVFKNSILHENVLISGYELEIYAPFSQSIKDNI